MLLSNSKSFWLGTNVLRKTGTELSKHSPIPRPFMAVCIQHYDQQHVSQRLTDDDIPTSQQEIAAHHQLLTQFTGEHM